MGLASGCSGIDVAICVGYVGVCRMDLLAWIVARAEKGSRGRARARGEPGSLGALGGP